ncbi:MAG TPA: PAS domain S-box protein [Candidatus Acidoferrum sp.]|jgi:PAS domain S-box-containing protein|nr:PAS domain S-box protein [Candidatus Acidoferrum sp.]
MSEHKTSSVNESENAAAARKGPAVSERLAQFERRQGELWRLTFFLLLVISIVFAVVSWDTIRSLAVRFEALPVGLVILVGLFGMYTWKRTQEMSELRGLVKGLETRDTEPPSDRQMDQLFAVIERSQQGYRDLIDSFDDVLLALTLDGEVRAVNRSFADLVGMRFQQIVGRHVSEFLEEANDEARTLIDRAMPRFIDRRHWTGVVHVKIKGHKTTFYYDCVAHAMMRGDQVHGVTILARDITASRKNEARFTELFETLQEGIYIVTPDDRILDANPALVRMLGYDSKEELLSRSLADVLPDEQQRRLLRQEVDTEPMLQGRELTLIRKDGHPIICLNTAAVVRDTSGRVLRYHGALMDITERREMERRLYQQQEFARRLIDSFPDLIFVLNSEGQYTFTSPRVKEILGYDPEDYDWSALGERTHAEDRPALQTLFAEMFTGQRSFGSLEMRVRHKSGDWRRVRCHLSPLFDETGKIDGVIISGRDVTDVKRLEEQLIQAEKLAAMGQMLAGVAHELNNPLTAILGVTELLRERAGMDDATKRQLDLTHRQARRAARIVQNLLEFSRPAAPQKKLLDVSNIIERTLQLHEHSLRRNSVSVEFHPQGGLFSVIGDANQLIQVFLNLISNAEHAIREVRESGRIQIRIGHIGPNVSVTVQDDGVGILPDALSKLFDPFYTTKRPGGGTGLGLSICTAIIREHGGSIDVETLPVGGSAFTVFLPLAVEKDSAAPSAAAVAALDGATPALPTTIRQIDAGIFSGRSILVLDDEESIRMLLEEGLSTHGLRVDTASTPVGAVQLVRDRSYDILLCDVNLVSNGHSLAGHEAAQQILSAAGANKPVVVYMTGDLVEPSPAGSNEPRRLQKPFRISEVLAIFREIFAATPVVRR